MVFQGAHNLLTPLALLVFLLLGAAGVAAGGLGGQVLSRPSRSQRDKMALRAEVNRMSGETHHPCPMQGIRHLPQKTAPGPGFPGPGVVA